MANDDTALLTHGSAARTAEQVEAPDLRSPLLYLNRELSLLQFNKRVLEQAKDERVPLLERMRFLCISSSNLDEFFEVRVAGLKQQVAYGSVVKGPDGLSPQEALKRISGEAHALVDEQYRVFNDIITPALEEEGIRFIRRSGWNAEQATWLRNYFDEELLPVLSPMGLDPAHPFPRVLNKSLNFIISLKGKDAFGRESGLAVLTAPRSLPRGVRLPKEIAASPYEFVFLSSIIHTYADDLFPGMSVTGCYQFRLTRNSDLLVDEEEVVDLRDALQGELPSRRYGESVRLEVADNCPPEVFGFLVKQFHLSEDDLYQVTGPVNLNRLMTIPDLVERPDLKYIPFAPGLPSRVTGASQMFDVIKQGDVLLHHPYQSFLPVVEFIRQAADDPYVLAIKQTLYRTGPDSAIVKALIDAAKKAKEVTVVVELRARFDEEANINLATQLQEAGAHVVYGVVGHKTHAKMAMVVRRENKKIARYVHLGTGNYHASTARIYTDYGLFTCDRDIGIDVHNVFIQLTGLGRASRLRRLLQAPFTMHSGTLERIARESEHARAGRPARIMAKMNSLLEPDTIRALYEASQAGVQIDLILRGICTLQPGVAGVSENIRVRSIIGRFLEHTRVFYFENAGESELWCSSADWMDRNFFRRVESCFPILQPALRKRVMHEIFELGLQDNQQAWELTPSGEYQRVVGARGVKPVSVQEALMLELGKLGA
jgi:polyphosphate kinase